MYDDKIKSMKAELNEKEVLLNVAERMKAKKESTQLALTEQLKRERELARQKKYIKSLTKILIKYISVKSERGINNFQTSINRAMSLIPITSGVTLDISDKKAVLKGASGRVSEVEGTGAKVLLSMFFRDQAITALGSIPLLVIDELIANLSEKTAVQFSEDQISLLGQDKLVILIEHKDGAFPEDIPTYVFSRDVESDAPTQTLKVNFKEV